MAKGGGTVHGRHRAEVLCHYHRNVAAQRCRCADVHQGACMRSHSVWQQNHRAMTMGLTWLSRPETVLW